jgi:hypothetical protein
MLSHTKDIFKASSMNIDMKEQHFLLNNGMTEFSETVAMPDDGLYDS